MRRSSKDGQYAEGLSLVGSEKIHHGAILQQRAMADKAALLQEIEQRNNKIKLHFQDMRIMVQGVERPQQQQP